MKRIISIVVATAAVGFMSILAGCYKDVVNPGADPNGPPQNVSFSGEIAPMLSKNCASSGCHDATPAHKPSLVTERSYNSLMTGGYINKEIPDQSTIYVLIKGGAMPPTTPLSSAEVKKVLDWIRNGAQNN